MKLDLYVSGDLAAERLRGGELHALAVAGELAAAGCDVRLLCRGMDAEDEHLLIAGLPLVRLRRVEPSRLLWRLGPQATVAPLTALLRLHGRGADAGLCFSPWLTLACRRAGACGRVVQIVADVLAASEAYERGRQFTFRRGAWLTGGPTAWAERRSYAACDLAVASSQVIADALAAGGIDRSKLIVAHPAAAPAVRDYAIVAQPHADDKTQAPAPTSETPEADQAGHDASQTAAQWRRRLGIDPQALAVLYVGALTPRKNPESLLRALAGQDAGMHLIIAGDGPLRGKLETLSESCFLRERAHFIGWQADMRPCYQAADILCHCASYETFGLIYVEAMRHGLALLGPANDPPRCWSSAGEIFRPGIDGLLYDAADPADLGRCLARLADEPRLLATLKRGAAERAGAFSWRGYTQRLLDGLK